MSEVPPPISIKQTPRSFSSLVRTDSFEAICSNTNSWTLLPHFFIHFTIFSIALFAPVTICTLDSNLIPDIPIGTLIPSWLSIMYSWGIRCIIFWSPGIVIAEADSKTASRSSCVTSLFVIGTVPVELILLIWFPAIPVTNDKILCPLVLSASPIDFLIDWTVASISTTIPLFNPFDSHIP